MEEQLPQKSNLNKTIIFAFVLVILSAIIAAIGIYAMQQAKITKVKADSSTQILLLQSQITQLQAQVDNAEKKAMVKDDDEKMEKDNNAMSDWQSYTNKRLGFTIQYPKRLYFDKDWIAGDDPISDCVGFGIPNNDKTWGVCSYASDFDIEASIAVHGSQFEDRTEKRETIKIDGYDAMLVTIITNKYEDWKSKLIYLKIADRIFLITNGAVDSKEYDSFFNSFRLL